VEQVRSISRSKQFLARRERLGADCFSLESVVVEVSFADVADPRIVGGLYSKLSKAALLRRPSLSRSYAIHFLVAA
jgi:hypothetical protein